MNERRALSPGELETALAAMPFAARLGIELTAGSPDEVVGRMPWTAERCTTGGVLHGGALMSLGDTIGAVCAFLNLPEGAGTATISSSSNLVRAVREGYVRATARPLHVGRSVILVRTDLHDDFGRLVGQVTQSQAVLTA